MEVFILIVGLSCSLTAALLYVLFLLVVPKKEKISNQKMVRMLVNTIGVFAIGSAIFIFIYFFKTLPPR